MKTTANWSTGLGAVLALAAIWAAPLRAETTECMEITTVPVTISTQGVHCLKQSFGINPGLALGTAIDITVNNVVIDFNGFKLGNLAAGASTEAIGIRGVNRNNVTIKNGIIRGFQTAISFEVSPVLRGMVLPADYSTSSGHVVEDMIIDNNTVTGIRMEGTGHTVQRNKVVTTGGSSAPVPEDAIGIYVAGPNHRVLENDVMDILSQGVPTGILVSDGDSTVVLANRVTNAEQVTSTEVPLRAPAPTIASRAILIGAFSLGTFVTGNHLSNYENGIQYNGIGIYSNNILFGMNIAFSGGIDGGGNFSATLVP